MALKSIGSKTRMLPQIVRALGSLHGETLVDVFGGSGVVVMNAGYRKHVYNDLNGDLVNFFRVLRDDELRPRLMRRLKNTPMARQEYALSSRIYFNGNNSFSALDPVERAAAIFWRCNYSYGGKYRSGGFAVSTSDRACVKENKTYWNRLKNLHKVAEFWRHTVLESLDFRKLIAAYGNRENVVMYCDPPYYGTENYYSAPFDRESHRDLADLLNTIKSGSVVSYYDFPGMSDLYPEDRWHWERFEATKNMSQPGAKAVTAQEILLTRIKKGATEPRHKQIIMEL